MSRHTMATSALELNMPKPTNRKISPQTRLPRLNLVFVSTLAMLRSGMVLVDAPNGISPNRVFGALYCTRVLDAATEVLSQKITTLGLKRSPIMFFSPGAYVNSVMVCAVSAMFSLLLSLYFCFARLPQSSLRFPMGEAETFLLVLWRIGLLEGVGWRSEFFEFPSDHPTFRPVPEFLELPACGRFLPVFPCGTRHSMNSRPSGPLACATGPMESTIWPGTGLSGEQSENSNASLFLRGASAELTPSR